jgi:hypothetical protein
MSGLIDTPLSVATVIFTGFIFPFNGNFLTVATKEPERSTMATPLPVFYLSYTIPIFRRHLIRL